MQRSHSSQTTPADADSRANSHTLTAASWHAEDPISSGVPPPLPLLVDVDVLESEVELFVCDVLVEVSEVDSGATVIPTTATLVVVESGVMVVGTVVVVEDVAAAWGIEDVDVVAAAWGVEDNAVELVLILVTDAPVSLPVDWILYAPSCPLLCPLPLPPPLEDEPPFVFEHSVWTPSPSKNSPISVFGYALVPAQTSFKVVVRLSRKPMHFAEQPPPEKSKAEQSVRGVLYAFVQAGSKPLIGWKVVRVRAEIA